MNNKNQGVTELITDNFFALLQRKGFTEISISEIVQHAGVGRASFYRNFSSKEDIAKRWTFEVTKRFLSESGIKDLPYGSRDYFIKLFTHLYATRVRAKLICDANLIYILRNEFNNSYLNSHIGEDEYQSYYLIGGIFNVFLHWLLKGCQESPDQIANKIIELNIRTKGSKKDIS